jgi:hypothetical protein
MEHSSSAHQSHLMEGMKKMWYLSEQQKQIITKFWNIKGMGNY